MQDFAKIATPLTRLTKKDISFQWREEQIEAFEHLKKLLSTAPVLAHFDPLLETLMHRTGSLELSYCRNMVINGSR